MLLKTKQNYVQSIRQRKRLAGDCNGHETIRADLRDADLRGADFRRKDLRGAMLDGDIMDKHTCFVETDLSGASMSGAYLSGTDLRHTKLNNVNVNGAVFSQIIVDNSTDFNKLDKNFPASIGGEMN